MSTISFSFLLPQISPLHTAEKVETIYVLAQRKQSALEKSQSVCFAYLFLIFHFKGLEHTLPIFPLVAKIQKTTYKSIFNSCSNISRFFLIAISFLDEMETQKFTIVIFIKEHPWHFLWQKLLALVFWQNSKPSNYIIPVHTPPMISNVILLAFFLETMRCYCECQIQFQKPVSHGLSFLNIEAFKVLIN